MNRIAKNILNPGAYSLIGSFALLWLRLIVGSFMISHGFGKLMMLINGYTSLFPDPLQIGVTASLILAVSAEFLCSILLITGFLTRLATIPLLITMFVAGFVFHATDPFEIKELALVYASIYVTILLTGAGKFSLDHLFFHRCCKRKQIQKLENKYGITTEL